MISTTLFRRGAALLVGVAALGVVPVAPTASAAVSLGAGGEYFPVAPARIFEQANVNADGSVDVDVVDVAGVPADDVLAVAVNVTIADAPGRGFASVSPSDYEPGSTAATSLINFQYSGHTVPNFGIIGVGTEGAITVDLDDSAGRRHGACRRRRLRVRRHLLVRGHRRRSGRGRRSDGHGDPGSPHRHPRVPTARPAAPRWVPQSRSRSRFVVWARCPTARTCRPS